MGLPALNSLSIISLILISFIQSIKCQDGGELQFNYEISSRVSENIRNFLLRISTASTLPAVSIINGVVNISSFATTPFSTGRDLFYNIKVLYSSEASIQQIGFENGIYYGLVNNVDFPYGIELDSNSLGKLNPVKVYTVKTNGLPDTIVNSSFQFDCRKRPWYLQSKAMIGGGALWTSPFLQVQPVQPTISFVNPIMIHNKFIGATAANIGLIQISNYLLKTYGNTGRKVFIVDIISGYLIASSMNAKLNSSGNQLMYPLHSEVNLISQAMQTLNEYNWPNHLVIMGLYYVQSVVYNDTIPGLQWRVIVLLPAILQPDHLDFHIDPGYYSSVVTIVGITIAISALFFVILTDFTKYRLMRITHPTLTRVMLIGILLLATYCFISLGQNTDYSCTIRPWLFNLSFTLAFTPLLVRTLYIYYIHVYNPIETKSPWSDSQLALLVIPFLLFDIFLLASTVYADHNGTSAVTTTAVRSDGAYKRLNYCNSDRNQAFFGVEVTYKSIMVIAATVLSFLLRKIPVDLVGGQTLKWVNLLVACTGGVTLLIYRNMTDIPLAITVESWAICLCCSLGACLYIVPVIYHIVVIGDVSKAEAVKQVEEIISIEVENAIHIQQ